MWGAFAVSAVLHAFAIYIYPALFPLLGPSDADLVLPVGTDVAGGLEVIQVVEIDVVDDVEPPEAPEFDPVEEREVAVTARGIRDGPVTDLAAPGISAAERLRPRLTDRRLWAPLPPEFLELTLEQREELALAGRLADWYDSVSAAAAADAAWTDWTFSDADGNRWGIGDGQLHLGGLSIPLPSFAPPPGAARERAWQWNEIARQGNAMAVQQTVRDRMEAIRARRDAERAAERADSTATPR